MAHLIDKDALVAEIERIDKSIGSDRFLSEYEQGCNQGKEDVCDALLYFIDTLEVKEVDFEKELDRIWFDNKFGDMFDNSAVDFAHIRTICRHFFKLGLRSTITEEDCKLIWNIGDEIPNMPEEEFFKELLKRYKAQKGEEV